MGMTSFEARRILEVDSNATADEIKKAFRRLASKHHPDKGGDAEEFKKIKAAYERLSDPSMGSSGNYGHSNKKSSTMDDGEEWEWGTWGPNGEGVNDFINDYIYSRGKYSKGWDEYGQHSATTAKVKVRLTPKEAFDGVESRRLAINTSNTTPSFELSISIPPGIAEGETIHMQKVDNITYVFVAEIVAPVSELSSDNVTRAFTINWTAGSPDYGNVYIKKPINPITLMQGGWVRVNCPLDNSEISVRIVPGTTSNSKLKVKGKGYWKNRSIRSRGDIILEVVPEIRPLESYSNEEKKDMLSQLLVSVNREEAIEMITDFLKSISMEDFAKIMNSVLPTNEDSKS